LQQPLQRIDFMDEPIAELEAEIEKQNALREEAVSLLAEIPGFDRTTAWSVIAEIGVDMSQFPSADAVASWAGVDRETTKAPTSVSAARHEKGAAGCGRNFARALGVPRDAKTATSPPTFNVSLPTAEKSGPSSPSVILCSWSATTCFSASAISRTWESITLTSSITKSSRVTLSSAANPTGS
jgi:hypothetical protein